MMRVPMDGPTSGRPTFAESQVPATRVPASAIQVKPPSRSFWLRMSQYCLRTYALLSSNETGAQQVVDYAMHGGPEGIVAVLGVKYTTAASVADEVADLAMTKLGRVAEKEIPDPPLPGGERTGEADPTGQAQGIGATSRAIALDHLKEQYGSRHTVILEYARENTQHLESVSSNTTTTVAEVLHAVREEMARTLSDVVLRRTELGTLAYPGDRAIERCADIMSHELGWDKKKKMDQIDDVMQAYELRDN